MNAIELVSSRRHGSRAATGRHRRSVATISRPGSAGTSNRVLTARARSRPGQEDRRRVVDDRPLERGHARSVRRRRRARGGSRSSAASTVALLKPPQLKAPVECQNRYGRSRVGPLTASARTRVEVAGSFSASMNSSIDATASSSTFDADRLAAAAAARARAVRATGSAEPDSVKRGARPLAVPRDESRGACVNRTWADRRRRPSAAARPGPSAGTP